MTSEPVKDCKECSTASGSGFIGFSHYQTAQAMKLKESTILKVANNLKMIENNDFLNMEGI